MVWGAAGRRIRLAVVARTRRLLIELSQGGAELSPGREPELGEHLAEVVLDGSRADEELAADLRVGSPICGQPGYLCFLRAQVLPACDVAFAGRLAGGEQLATRPLGEGLGSHAVEQVVGGSQLLSGV